MSSQLSPSVGSTLKNRACRALSSHALTSKRSRSILAAAVAETSIYGLDRNPTLLRMTRERFPDATVIRGELTKPPYVGIPEHSVDLVTAHLVLQYLSIAELSACLGEAHRLLSPGGYLAIGLPHPMRINEQAEADYFARRMHVVCAPWGGMTESSGLTIGDYLNTAIGANFCFIRVEEPEIAEEGLQHEEAGNYSPGPTRLMMLMQTSPIPDSQTHVRDSTRRGRRTSARSSPGTSGRFP
jgi:SAM-dependent methyltransferase